MKSLWVAYSGGADSHVLLHLAVQAGYKPRAVHINDQLSPNADKWQKHCQKICADLQVELSCIKVNAKPKAKQSPEDAARIARRHAWLNLLAPGDILMLGQHADDQAETIVYRLLRGSGPNGLAGMRVETKLENITLYRPFLDISKQAILDYARKYKLNFIHDESNLDINFDRNYIRHKIMPMIRKRWPAAVASINRAGLLNADLCDLLEPYLKERLESCLSENKQELNLNQLKQHSVQWQGEILRAWLQMHKLMPSNQQIDLIIAEVIAARIDAQPRFTIADKIVRRFQNRLFILNPDDEKKSEQAQGKKAKKIFQEHGIPPWQRADYRLVFKYGKLSEIAGLWVDKK